MKINKNENVILVDVDSTLILYGTNNVERSFNYYGMNKKAAPHFEHIALIKSYKKRGFFVRVHSNNGWEWAQEVVTVLGLTEIIDEIETKPTRFMDDVELPHNDVIGMRVYIKP